MVFDTFVVRKYVKNIEIGLTILNIWKMFNIKRMPISIGHSLNHHLMFHSVVISAKHNVH